MKVYLQEKDALLLGILIAVLTAVFSVIILSGSIKSLQSNIKSVNAEYKKAENLYKKMKNNNNASNIFKGDILLFVQKIEALPGLKSKILSVGTTDVQNGVQIRMGGLNLSELLGVLKTIESYQNISIKRFVLQKSFSKPRLVDLSLVLGKKI